MLDYEPPWVHDIRVALGRLYDAIEEFAGSSPTPQQVGEAVAALNYAKSEFGMAYDNLVRIAIEALPDGVEMRLPDGVTIEKKSSTSRKGWQHKELAASVVERILDMSVDMDTGERMMTTPEMIAEVFRYVQPSYWRVKELNAIGINADHYSEVGDVKTNVIVRKGSQL